MPRISNYIFVSTGSRKRYVLWYGSIWQARACHCATLLSWGYRPPFVYNLEMSRIPKIACCVHKHVRLMLRLFLAKTGMRRVNPSATARFNCLAICVWLRDDPYFQVFFFLSWFTNTSGLYVCSFWHAPACHCATLLSLKCIQPFRVNPPPLNVVKWEGGGSSCEPEVVYHVLLVAVSL